MVRVNSDTFIIYGCAESLNTCRMNEADTGKMSHQALDSKKLRPSYQIYLFKIRSCPKYNFEKVDKW